MRRPSVVHRAFTLIELLLVLVILAVLAAVVVPNLLGRGEQAKRTATIADIKSLKDTIKTFENDTGGLPDPSLQLQDLVARPSNVSNWNGPYIDKLPTDKWGTPYKYELVNNEQGGLPFNITSAGKDMQFGTDDDIDIYTEK